MTSSLTHPAKASTFLAVGVGLAAMGIYAVKADDRPGAPVLAFLMMVAAVVLGVKAVRNRLPTWTARAAVAIGVTIAGVAAFLIHAAVVAGPLFAHQQDLTSVVDSAPSPQYAAAVERARDLVRTAVLEQTLPGVS